MKKQKSLLLVLIIVQIFLLSGCIFDEKHMSLKEAETLAEELTGEDVTHVMTNEEPDGKSIYYVFADEKGREFTINSHLAREQFEAFQYGPYKCLVSENYSTGMLKANETEIIEILMKYDLLSYVALGRFINTNIYKGDGCVTPDIYFKVPVGTAEENFNVLKRIAKAGTEIDSVLALTYDPNYAEKAKENGICYQDYSHNCCEIQVTFDISPYDCDVATCEFSVSEEARLTEEQIVTTLYEMLEKVEFPSLETLEAEVTLEGTTEQAEKMIWDDLDGNGTDEFFILNNEKNGELSLYFNEELIYQYAEEMPILNISEKEYIDLDNDGAKEIFVSFLPAVNSMPLKEWFVLKQTDSGWKLLEMYHKNGDMTQNAFPIHITLKEKEFVFSITCDGCGKEIVYDATTHYETMKQDSYLSDTYKAFSDSDFKVGDEVGCTSAWGIWDIKSGLYQNKNCLIAQHGINGAGGSYDFLGCIDVYFNYDNSGKICILDIVFEEADFT